MTNKTLRYFTLTYLIFFTVALGIERHGFERGPMSPLDRMLAAPILWAFALDAVLSGSILGRMYWIDRSDRPFGYWTMVVFEFLFGLFLFCWGIRDAIR